MDLDQHKSSPLQFALFKNNCDANVICNELPNIMKKLNYDFDEFYIGATNNVKQRSKAKGHRHRNLHLLCEFSDSHLCGQAEKYCIANLKIDGKKKMNVSMSAKGYKACEPCFTRYLYVAISSSVPNVAKCIISRGDDPLSRCLTEDDVERIFHVRIEKSYRQDGRVDKKYHPKESEEKRIFKTHSKCNHAYARSIAELQRMLPALLSFREITHDVMYKYEDESEESDETDDEPNDTRASWWQPLKTIRHMFYFLI